MRSTVLIVEDFEGTAVPLEIALVLTLQVKVVILASALEALTMLETDADIKALITDLHLPKMDGFELIRRVREDSRYAALPIVVISGDSSPETPHRVSALGADAFFLKPYSPLEIRKRLETLLNVH